MTGGTYWYAVTPECSAAQSWASRHGQVVYWGQADWQYAPPPHDAMTLVSPVNCETAEQVRHMLEGSSDSYEPYIIQY